MIVLSYKSTDSKTTEPSMKESSNSTSPEEHSTPVDASYSTTPPTPQAYDDALERVTQALEQTQPSTPIEKVLWGFGLSLSFILFIPLLLEWLSYPYWLELFYDLSIFVEAALPLCVSFFLKNKQQATILRVIGTIVLLMYILTY